MLTNPGNQSGTWGISASLQLAASDPNGDELGYGASGLPAGMTLDATTGLISGTPSATGNFNVVVAASDGMNTAIAVVRVDDCRSGAAASAAAAAAGSAAIRRAGDLHGQHCERSERAAALGLR